MKLWSLWSAPEAAAVAALKPREADEAIKAKYHLDVERRVRTLELKAQYPDAEAVHAQLQRLIVQVADPLLYAYEDGAEAKAELFELIRFAGREGLIPQPEEPS